MHPRCRAAFTLVELLTVITIIAVLAGILLAVIGKARTAANESTGAANLRQIALATLAYAGDHRGQLPYGQTLTAPTGDFSTAISSYLAGAGGDGSYNDKHGYDRVFRDPSAAVEGGACHFTTNPSVMGYDYNKYSQTSLSHMQVNQIGRPAQVVLYFDGAQIPGYGNASEKVGWAVDGGSLNPGAVLTAANANVVVKPGPNQDNSNTQGNIRWRVRNDTAAKFAFVDGHTAILSQQEVRKRNFLPQ
jgi:prepilin-type N-terminal cleavage/methylation domain-containing protein